MKRQLIYIISCMTLLGGCIDFGDSTETISITIQVSNPESCLNLNMADHIVTLKGTEMLKGTTNAQGRITFTDIIPEVYNISTSWKITSEEYTQATGIIVEKKGYTISGTLTSQLLSASTKDTIEISTNITQDQSVLISKVYYSGNMNDNNKSYQYGKYVELYNNSDQEIDISGLYLALIESASPNSDYPLKYLTDTVIAKQVFRIPNKIVQPGTSVLLVNSAIDHTSKGASKDPNLLDADFEAKDKSSGTKAHVNNPDVPELQLIYSYTNNTYMNLVNGGYCSVIIFETDEDVEHDWVNKHLTYRYGKSNGYFLMKIPTKFILDAVEIMRYTAATGVNVSEKRLYEYLDAGYTYNEASYDGKAVKRKTLYVSDDGRVVLQDTNNSLNDFEITDELNPRQYK